MTEQRHLDVIYGIICVVVVVAFVAFVADCMKYLITGSGL